MFKQLRVRLRSDFLKAPCPHINDLPTGGETMVHRQNGSSTFLERRTKQRRFFIVCGFSILTG
ncbi:hypothetical protein [Shouchella clausii]|uniref:hypothetical protein n=1 Tax=Shouchella clausii TaxID=79880 RepID=UPI000BA6BA2F|nr:hypothetical protein [Shouchella clausii]PAD17137.1 hypothetical protein CHH73_10545 [Shouchella clausii]